MVDHSFYKAKYCGDSVSEVELPRLVARADAVLARYKRVYTVTAPNAEAEKQAICAMADALYYFETAQNTAQSSSIGSVSSSQQMVDISPAAQSKELYRCACLYLDIYRGCGSC